MIMPCDELRKRGERGDVTENKVNERVERRPENKHTGYAQYILFENGANADVPS